MVRVDIKGDKLEVYITDLLTDDVLREVCKHAVFDKMDPRIARKLIDDLTEERDKLHTEREELRDKCFDLEERLRHLWSAFENLTNTI